MNTQRPYENVPRPPGTVPFQANRQSQGFPYYAAQVYSSQSAFIPTTIPMSSGLDNKIQVPLPASSPVFYQPPLPIEPSPHAIISEAVPNIVPVSCPLTLSLPAPPFYTPVETKKPTKRIYKSSKGIYKCDKCERTYLSYPALYTHIKLKHPDLSQLAPVVKSNRGRPRKSTIEDEKEFACGAWFEDERRKGGPTDPILGFPEAYAAIYKKAAGEYSKHPIHVALSTISCTRSIKQEESDEVKEPPDEYSEIRHKRQTKCDHVLAEYLAYAAQRVSKEYYATVTKFILLYRECANSAVERLNEEKKKLPDILLIQENKAKSKSEQLNMMTEGEYCLRNNAEQLPDVSNNFITTFLPEKHPEFNIDEAKGLTLNLCNWLFHNKYTCSTLSLVCRSLII